MKNQPSFDRYRMLRLVSAVFGLSVALGACTETTGSVATTALPPEDYRLRHPITVQEAEHSIVIFVGHARGGLSGEQRADVMGLARTWVHEGTGAVIADVPVGTPNAQAATSAFREIRAVLSAGGVPSRAIVLHRYHPEDPGMLPTIRLSYPRMAAVAGPCGTWPDDLGPSLLNRSYSENKSYYNFGCAYQRNMAAMVDNPSDLEQPRSETPAYGPRRDEAFEKYRKGAPTATTYPDAEKAKLSDTGK